MDKTSTIAGVILCLNEERNLPRALTSLKWCDELLVVDSGSTDLSQNVSRLYNARFVVHKQEGAFLITDQRNWALEQCDLKSEWVVFLDADEEIGPALAHEIQRMTSTSSPFTAFELTPRYWFLGKWLKRTQGFPNWHPRLLRRESVRFEGGVWESFSQNALVSRIQYPYEHYAFSKGLDDWIERHQRYSSWDAQEIYQFLNSSVTRTARRRTLRIAMSYLWPIRPLLRFIQKYFLQFGFLEGWQGLLFCLLMSFYDLMTVIKIIELRRIQERQPL